MSTRFNADEVFEIALQIERNGSAFYRAAAERMPDAKRRELFSELAAWEGRHEQLFAALRAGLSAAEREPTVFDPEGEAALYLRAIADSEVFDIRGGAGPALTGGESYEAILRQALDREKDAVIFFLGMREFVPEHLGKGKIDSILKEEMSHIRALTKELAGVRR